VQEEKIKWTGRNYETDRTFNVGAQIN